MQKIIITGSPGAGKSTFARKLRDDTGLPLYYLDMLWHKADGSSYIREEFDRELEKILRRERWILDGNYQRTLEKRLQACDTVFLLDYPVELCLEGARARIGQKREDLPWIETAFDPEFQQWILDFPKNGLPQIYELLKKYRGQKEMIIFHSRAEADSYLKALEQK